MLSARLAAWTTRFLAISSASSTVVALGVLFWLAKGFLSVEPIKGEKLLLVRVCVGLLGSAGRSSTIEGGVLSLGREDS